MTDDAPTSTPRISRDERRAGLWSRVRLANKIGLLYGLLLLLLIGSGLVFFNIIGQLNEARGWVRHTREVDKQLEKMMTGVVNQESGFRGYLVSGKPIFLDSYSSGRKQFAVALDAARRMTTDNPAQQARLSALQATVEHWQTSIAEPAIQQTRAGMNLQQAGKSVASGAGLNDLRTIRQLLEQAEEVEQTLLHQRERVLEDSVRNSRYTIAGFFAFGVLLWIFVSWMVQRLAIRPISQLTLLMQRMANGDRDFATPFQQRGDEIGAVARSVENSRLIGIEVEKLTWIREGVRELTQALQVTRNYEEFGRCLIKHLCEHLHIDYGMLFLLDEAGKHIERVAAYGISDPQGLRQRFALGEGLIGEAVASGEVRILSPVPKGYLPVVSGLGTAPPTVIGMHPLIGRNGVLGVVELAKFEVLEEERRQYLDEALSAAGLNLESLIRGTHTQVLLEQTRSQAEELRQSGERLREQQEELRVANEELEEKSQAVELYNKQLQNAQAELRARAVQLEDASRYKSEFLANMSHELRTPLNSLLILSKSLADNETGHLDADEVEAAQIVHASGSDLLALINDILDLSKIEAGKMELVAETVQLDSFTQDIKRNFQHVADNKELQFNIEVEEGAPASLVTDPAKLRGIINNLLSNAFKFTHEGSVTLRVSGCSEDDNYAVSLQVIDTGIGIPADKHMSIFNAFQQVDGTTSRDYGGTGLGLSICQGLVNLLQGVLTLSSAPGKGSCFTLRLPAVVDGAAATPAPAAQPQAQPQGMPATSAPPTSADADNGVLIIEDDQIFARLVARLANDMGYTTRIANNGEQGIAMASQAPPAGILLDIGLPDIDGWEVMRRLRAQATTAHIPIHIISGMDVEAQGRAMGAVGVLSKPASRESLQAALQRVVVPRTGRRPRVLYVGEQAGSDAALAQLPDSAGIELEHAADGASALQALAEPCSCVIVALDLPDMSCVKLLRQISQRQPELPMIVHASRPLNQDEHQQLREFTDSIIIDGPHAGERMQNEVTLFLHSIQKGGAGKGKTLPDVDLAGHTVLLVDDDMRNIFALSRSLRALGMNVVMAQDGHKALAQLENNQAIEIVLMDIMMPGMDGYTAIRKIRENAAWQRLPVIAVTAKAMPGDREKCIDAGASDYLSKPVDVDKLTSMMRVWLA